MANELVKRMIEAIGGYDRNRKRANLVAALRALAEAGPSEGMLTQTAITLSLADPDERALPAGTEMVPFYKALAKAAISTFVEKLISEIEESSDV